RPLCPCLPAPLCSVSISFLTRYPPSRPPPAFPTRRSSDLQASQFGLTREVKLVTEILELENLKAVGEAMTGTIGSSRYPFTVDTDRKSTRLNSSHEWISYAVFCLKKKKVRAIHGWLSSAAD